MELLANIDVDDVAVATEFYCQALNLTVGRRFGDAGVELLGASSAIYLLEKPTGTVACHGAGPTRHYSRHWTPVHLDFVVPDVNAAVTRAVAAGAVLERPVRDEPYGKIAGLADPFGNGICLLEMSARGYDALVE